VSPRVCTCIPYWWDLSAGRCRGSSATPFQFIVIIDYQPHPTVHRRSFLVAAARVWNSLPDLVTSAPSVAVFRSRLKTHLFNISYPYPLWLYSACAVTLSCFGHYNRSCLLTYGGFTYLRQRAGVEFVQNHCTLNNMKNVKCLWSATHFTETQYTFYNIPQQCLTTNTLTRVNFTHNKTIENQDWNRSARKTNKQWVQLLILKRQTAIYVCAVV